MTLTQALRDLDDARAELKRIKGAEKTAKRLIGSGIGTGLAATAAAVTVHPYWGYMWGVAAVLLILGVLLWMWVNVETYHSVSRMQKARQAVSHAEAAYDEAAKDTR